MLFQKAMLFLTNRMRKIFIKIINFYQKNSRVFKKSSCVFYPSCSEYSKQAIKKYGIFKGIYLGIKRIIKCHPWQKNQIDLLK